MSEPHIFVSYSHQDQDFAQQLVNDLRTAGATVWYDVSGVGYGDFIDRIDDALRQCEWLVLVLTPAAIASQYVKMEVNGALHRVQQGYMRAVIPVLGAPCAPDSIPALWDVLHRYDATHNYPAAIAGICQAVGLSTAAVAVPSPADLAHPAQQLSAESPAVPSDHFPPRLKQLGFVARVINGVEVIVPRLCPILAGPFLMGSDSAHAESDTDEQPQHLVSLAAFQISRYPITVAEYACAIRQDGMPEPGRPLYSEKVSWVDQLTRLEHPVVYVTWYDARAYAQWLSEQTGQSWRLPTEAEWEKAARGSDGRTYPWGTLFDSARCNTLESGQGETTPVGSYPTGASTYGVQELAGNVWEWTSSLFNSYPYRTDDGREDALSIENRVVRGGAWNRDASLARSAYRGHIWPDRALDNVGFRLVCGDTAARG